MRGRKSMQSWIDPFSGRSANQTCPDTERLTFSFSVSPSCCRLPECEWPKCFVRVKLRELEKTKKMDDDAEAAAPALA